MKADNTIPENARKTLRNIAFVKVDKFLELIDDTCEASIISMVEAFDKARDEGTLEESYETLIKKHILGTVTVIKLLSLVGSVLKPEELVELIKEVDAPVPDKDDGLDIPFAEANEQA